MEVKQVLVVGWEAKEEVEVVQKRRRHWKHQVVPPLNVVSLADAADVECTLR